MTAHHEVFLSLGSNIGNSKKQIFLAYEEIENHPDIQTLKRSHLYLTSPVSSIPQRAYVNGACHFFTSMAPLILLQFLQGIEKKLGKVPKSKEAPRKIDIDILFFGKIYLQGEQLQIPHPRWKERLFVLIPLLDLTETITYPIGNNKVETFSLREYVRSFPSDSGQTIFPLNKNQKKG